MISQLMSGSRLPVGSSAMMSRGSWTSARAIAVRCCSPPDSWAGIWRAWAVSPTSASTRSTAGVILRRGVPVTSSANATFSQTVLVGSSLKSWKTMPILRRIFGTWRRGSRARSWPSRTTSPWVASSSRMSSLMSVDLPAPDGPTRKTKSPSGMTRSTSRSASLPFGYRFVTSWSTRTARSWDACSVGPAQDAFAQRARWRRGWGDGQDRLRGRCGRRQASPTPALHDSVRGHGRGATSA